MSTLEQLFPEGTVVWYHTKTFSWWPGKVSHEAGSIHVETFEKCPVQYKVTADDLLKLRKFPSDEALEMVIEGRKKLKKKKGWLREYLNAIQDAVETLQKVNPDFSLDFNPDDDVSYLSDLSLSGTPQFHKEAALASNSSTPTANSTPKLHKENRSRSGTPFSLQTTRLTPPTDILIPSAGRKRGRKEPGKDGSPQLQENGGGSKRAKSASSSGPIRKQAVAGSLKGASKKLEYYDDSILQVDPLIETAPPPLPPSTPPKELPPRTTSSTPHTLTTHHTQDDHTPPQQRPLEHSTAQHVDPHTPSRTQQEPHTSTTTTSAISSSTVQDCSPSFSHQASSPQDTTVVDTTTPHSTTAAAAAVSSTTIMAAVKKPTPPPREPAMVDTSAHYLTSFSVLDSSDSEHSVALSGSEGEEEEEEDDLPRINLDADSSVRVHQLQPNDVIWAKFDKFPYWPALVTTVVTPKKRKSKSRASVLFFGYNDSKTISIKSQKIARFQSKTNEEYIEAGRGEGEGTVFMAAVEEAKRLINSRASREIIGTPKEQFKRMMSLRPQSKQVAASPMALQAIRKKLDLQAFERKQVEPVPQEEDTCSGISSDEEEMEEDPVYGYDKVFAAIEEMKPELVAIVQGRSPSNQHQMFVSGQHTELKRAEKYGPLSKWPAEKLTSLVERLQEISVEASEGRFKMNYSHEVLLPEAVKSLICMFEGLTSAEATEKMDTY